MKTIALHEMGEVIRKVRKERGLRLEDLADQNISPATVSNIERGVAHVSPEKITYLLKKLDLPLHKLPEMLEKEQEELKKIQFKLLTISTLRQIGLLDEALKELEQLNLDDSHPFVAQAYYQKGQIYLAKKRWKQAERAFYNALRHSQQNSYKEHNMEATSYFGLGLCAFLQNKWEEALDLFNNGIEAFDKEGEKQEIHHLLIRYKALALYELGRITEAFHLVNDHWNQLSSVEEVDTILTFYWLRAELSRRTGLLEEAIQYALKGIDIARFNQHYSRMFDLWIVLGTIYSAQQKWETAEIALTMAKRLEGKLPIDSRLSIVYTRLGILKYKQERYDEAYPYFLQAVHLSEKFQDWNRVVNNLIMLGDLCITMDKRKEAIQHYERAINLTQKNNLKEKEYHTWYRLAQCYHGLDEDKFQYCMRKTFELKQMLPAYTLDSLFEDH
jgi:tetratricopeptide (TPR) repeat protein